MVARSRHGAMAIAPSQKPAPATTVSHESASGRAPEGYHAPSNNDAVPTRTRCPKVTAASTGRFDSQRSTSAGMTGAAYSHRAVSCSEAYSARTIVDTATSARTVTRVARLGGDRGPSRTGQGNAEGRSGPEEKPRRARRAA